MSQRLLAAELAVLVALREHRGARATYLKARAKLHKAIAERDTIRGSEPAELDTCDHGHPACGIAGKCGDECE